MFLKIPFANKAAQKDAKSAGAKWHPEVGLWKIEDLTNAKSRGLDFSEFEVDFDGHDDRLLAVLAAILEELRTMNLTFSEGRKSVQP